MTASGCSAGATEAHRNNLQDIHYETFAEYLTEIVKHFKDEWGVTFTTLDPINEAVSPYWKAEGFQYPHSLVLGENLWVIYSVGKEDVQVTRIPINEIINL